MIYLSGSLRPELVHPRLGWMLTPEMGQMPPEHGWWAADNGCYSHPEAFTWEKYERWLMRAQTEAGDRMLFATAPDVPFDMDGTLSRFDEYRGRMREAVPRVALVSQDGMHPEDVPWNDIDALFVGGTTEWKTGQDSAAICAAARQRGLWVHMGRVNSEQRIKAAQTMGCDSADGTFLKYGPDVLWPRLRHWLTITGNQPTFVL